VRAGVSNLFLSGGSRAGWKGHTSVHTKYLVINNNTQSEKVKHVCEIVPDIGIAIFPRTFGVKAIGLGDAARLVVASYQMHTVGVSKLQTDEKGNGFDAKHAAVDVVSYVRRRSLAGKS